MDKEDSSGLSGFKSSGSQTKISFSGAPGNAFLPSGSPSAFLVPPPPALPPPEFSQQMNLGIDNDVPFKHGTDSIQALISETTENFVSTSKNKYLAFARILSEKSGVPLKKLISTGSDELRDFLKKRFESLKKPPTDVEIKSFLQLSITESPTFFVTEYLQDLLSEVTQWMFTEQKISVDWEELISWEGYRTSLVAVLVSKIGLEKALGTNIAFVSVKKIDELQKNHTNCLNKLTSSYRLAAKMKEVQ
jgi:hypothetical protein